MNDMLLEIISVLCTVVILPLITIAGNKLIRYISSKIENDRTARLLSLASSIVLNAVKTVLQTYVDTLKENGSFDKDAQLEALNKAKIIALSQMSDEIKDFIRDNFGDVDDWLTSQIEATINTIKKE